VYGSSHGIPLSPLRQRSAQVPALAGTRFLAMITTRLLRIVFCHIKFYSLLNFKVYTIEGILDAGPLLMEADD